ncbi:hypothetical protein HanXRQr2_Chr10g0432131 [Helianthus annuus]|uniref:Uncharacterized protein n=1 Tax=Helianthus annuus TaxID=4232 RepID=A0A9K3HWS1_HELAN|nr:hypothetical protein HanXRQr2_Chr10g0432131 [Helianthus annuus]
MPVKPFMKPIKPIFINHGFSIPSGSVQHTTTKPPLLCFLLRRRSHSKNQRATPRLCHEPTTIRSRL